MAKASTRTATKASTAKVEGNDPRANQAANPAPATLKQSDITAKPLDSDPNTATANTASTEAARKASTQSDDTPEAQPTAAEKKVAATRMFKTADEAALRGLPETMTQEQYDNQVRRAATGM